MNNLYLKLNFYTIITLFIIYINDFFVFINILMLKFFNNSNTMNFIAKKKEKFNLKL